MSYSFHCAITGTFEKGRCRGRAVHPDTVEFRSTSQPSNREKKIFLEAYKLHLFSGRHYDAFYLAPDTLSTQFSDMLSRTPSLELMVMLLSRRFIGLVFM